MNQPSFQFYPGDWLRDDVSGLSLASQGLWLRLLIVMHDSPRRGFLALSNGPMPAVVAARKCGTDLATFELLLKEIEDAGVASRSDDGSLFSRRMVRDEQDRARERDKKRKQRGKIGASKDPPKQGCPPSCPDDVPPVVPAMSLRSSSSSSSSRLNTNTPPLPPCGGDEELRAILAIGWRTRPNAASGTSLVAWRHSNHNSSNGGQHGPRQPQSSRNATSTRGFSSLTPNPQHDRSRPRLCSFRRRKNHDAYASPNRTRFHLPR